MGIKGGRRGEDKKQAMFDSIDTGRPWGLKLIFQNLLYELKKHFKVMSFENVPIEFSGSLTRSIP